MYRCKNVAFAVISYFVAFLSLRGALHCLQCVYAPFASRYQRRAEFIYLLNLYPKSFLQRFPHRKVLMEYNLCYVDFNTCI